MTLPDYTQVTMTTYTSDVSGAASALYELGGMTVIHDASGCNSTYSTHDEPRWETMNSAVYVSALNEMDAVLGNEDLLTESLIRAAESLRPAFLSLAGTIIPMMTGSDLRGIARDVEEATGVPSFALSTNGMRAYSVGAAQSWIELARRFVEPLKPSGGPLVNLLGATPLDFSIRGEIEAVRGLLEDAGIGVNACWAMGSSLDELRGTRRAALNLVLSSAGLPLAQVFARHFGMPFFCGLPVGGRRSPWLWGVRSAIGKAQTFPLPERERNLSVQSPDSPCEGARVIVIHEPLRALEIVRALGREGIPALAASPLPALGMQSPSLSCGLSEEEIEAVFRKTLEEARSRGEPDPVFLGDPLFFASARRSGLARCVPLAHEAASGRIWRDDIPNLFDEDAWSATLGTLRN